VNAEQRERAKLRVEIRRLKAAMESAEKMLRAPSDPFVMVNVANFLNQERTRES
jgi:hypothetical protein